MVEVKNKRLRQRLQWCGRWFCKVVVISGVDKWRTKKKKKKKNKKRDTNQTNKNKKVDGKMTRKNANPL